MKSEPDPAEGDRPRLLLPIDLPPVADLDDLDDPSLIIDRIYDAIVPLTDAIPFLPGELFIAVRAGSFGQSSDPINDATQVLFRQSTQLTLR